MARRTTGVEKVNVYIQTDVLDALRRMAARKGVAYAELLREAARQYVLAEGPKLLAQEKAIRESASGS